MGGVLRKNYYCIGPKDLFWSLVGELMSACFDVCAYACSVFQVVAVN